jgi:hypothetical protein
MEVFKVAMDEEDNVEGVVITSILDNLLCKALCTARNAEKTEIMKVAIVTT